MYITNKAQPDRVDFSGFRQIGELDFILELEM